MKMNLRKLLMIAGGLLIFYSGALASVNEKGIDYYRAELYGAAKIYLSNKAPSLQGGDKAEAYYYLGECYAATEMADSAAYYYKKAIETDAEYPYAYIGEGKLELKKGNLQPANELFKKAIGFSKKNPAIHTAVAEAYINAKKYDEANETLDKARKVDKNYSGIYVAEGDMLMAQGKTGDACAKYENAILFDKTDKVAYLKEARVYKTINPTLSLEILDRLLEVDPDYIPAFAEIGEINFNTGFYTKSIEAYAKFIEIPGVPIKHHANYASLLYFTKNYAQSQAEIRKILVVDPQNVVMHRIQSYNNYELGNYELGLEQMEAFFRLIPQEQIIALDYIYFGRLLDKNKQPELAVESYKKALEKDNTKTDVYKEIATAYNNQKNYVEAVNYYKEYIDKDPDATLIDIFTYGQACYSAANQALAENADPNLTPGSVTVDSIKRTGYLTQADNIFEQVIERSPSSYLGYLWRGHCNSGMDLDASKGLAKPYYEKALEIMLANNADGKRNKDIIDIYRYLGFYYYVQNDIPNSRMNFSKILEIDPENEIAKQALEGIKK